MAASREEEADQPPLERRNFPSLFFSSKARPPLAYHPLLRAPVLARPSARALSSTPTAARAFAAASQEAFARVDGRGLDLVVQHVRLPRQQHRRATPCHCHIAVCVSPCVVRRAFRVTHRDHAPHRDPAPFFFLRSSSACRSQEALIVASRLSTRPHAPVTTTNDDGRCAMRRWRR